MVIDIDLPDGAEVLVKTHQNIDFDTVVARKKSENIVSIPLAKMLHIKPADIFLHLKKSIGEVVHKGELIAERKKFLSKLDYYSDFDGEIKEIDHTTGDLVFAVKLGQEIEINSIVKGQIVSIKRGHIEVKLPEGHQFEAKDVSADFGGEAIVIHNETLPLVNEELVNKKIVFAERLPVYDQIKMEALDAKGLITLYQLPQDTYLPTTKIKNSSDWKKVLELKLPYCLVDKNSSVIYFYK